MGLRPEMHFMLFEYWR